MVLLLLSGYQSRYFVKSFNLSRHFGNIPLLYLSFMTTTSLSQGLSPFPYSLGLSFADDLFQVRTSSRSDIMSGWPSTDDMASALPEPTTDAWGATDSSATPGVDAWGASGDVGDAGEAGGEDEAARPSYTPAGITKTPGEHGWADKKNAAYDYANLSKTSKEVAEEQAARQEASGQAGEDL